MGKHLQAPAGVVLSWIAVAGLVLVSACGTQTGDGSQETAAQGSTESKVEPALPISAAFRDPQTLAPALFPRQGKLTLAAEPAEGVFGQIYVNSKTGREWIYDGVRWVPHDKTVAEHYRKLGIAIPEETGQGGVAAPASDSSGAASGGESFSDRTAGRRAARMTQDEVCVDGDPLCTPTGAHGKHGSFGCATCHKVAGRLVFDKSGPAYGAGWPTPSFDATDAAKSCSNVACHSVKRGTFSYYFPGGDGEPVLNTVTYGADAPRVTPSWYASGASACAACHDDPPRNGSSGSNTWHSGYHGGQGPAGAYNQCQLCHPDATSPNNGIGDTITTPTLHANGVANVQAAFKSACFGCH